MAKRLKGLHIGGVALLVGALETAVPMLQGVIPVWVYISLVILAAVLPGLTDGRES